MFKVIPSGVRSALSACSICPVFRSFRASLLHWRAGSMCPKFTLPFWNANDRQARWGRTLFRSYNVAINFPLQMFLRRLYATESDSGKLLRVNNTAGRSSYRAETELLNESHLVLQAFLSFLNTLFFVFLFRPKSCSRVCVFMYAMVCLEEFSILCHSWQMMMAMWSTYVSINTS